MNDEDAEAVLRALGATLTWEAGRAGLNNSSKPCPYEIAGVGQARYLVVPTKRFWRFNVYEARWQETVTKRAVTSPRRYKTIADAKDACVCHHATGKWR